MHIGTLVSFCTVLGIQQTAQLLSSVVRTMLTAHCPGFSFVKTDLGVVKVLTSEKLSKSLKVT